MTEDENIDTKEEKKNKRPDISKLNEIESGWECSVDTGSC